MLRIERPLSQGSQTHILSPVLGLVLSGIRQVQIPPIRKWEVPRDPLGTVLAPWPPLKQLDAPATQDVLVFRGERCPRNSGGPFLDRAPRVSESSTEGGRKAHFQLVKRYYTYSSRTLAHATKRPSIIRNRSKLCLYHEH